MLIRIKTGCRLHLGFMDLNGDLGRLYGSIGISLRKPNTIVTIRKDKELVINGGDEKRIFEIVDTFGKHYRLEPRARIHLEMNIPEHVGLGSGTQLALAISAGLAKLFDIKADTRELSIIMGRGRRSGIGVACFEKGGLVIDSGQKTTGEVSLLQPPDVVFRHKFPEDWRFIIVIPVTERGLSGREENEVFKCINPSREISERICRLVQIKLLPSLIEEDIKEFGSALTDIDRKTGMFFDKAQGGIHKNEMAFSMIECMLGAGAYGGGQSSWGPALYALGDKMNSKVIADCIKRFLHSKNMRGDVLISSCNNRGAQIKILEEQVTS